MKKLLISTFSALCLLLVGTSFAPIADNPDAIIGVWKTGEGTAMVRIYKNGEKYQGNLNFIIPVPYCSGKKIAFQSFCMYSKSDCGNKVPFIKAFKKMALSSAVETIPPSAPKELIALGMFNGEFPQYISVTP